MATHKGLTCCDRELILGGMEPGNDKLAEAQALFTSTFINNEYIIWASISFSGILV